jgi:hypothetical protein
VFAILALISEPALTATPLTLIARGSEWSYRPVGSRLALPPDGASGTRDAQTAWLEPGFRESWKIGRAGSGLAQLPDGHRSPRLLDSRRVFQFRRTFELSDEQLANTRGLHLELIRGDGIVVFLNGTEVYRMDSPYDPTAATPAHGTNVEEDSYLRWVFRPEHLVSGTNVVAVETYRRRAETDEHDFDLELVATSGPAAVWRGPYLQKPALRSVTLRFATDVPVRPVMRFGKRLEQLDRRAQGPLEVEHTLVAEGLEPDTTYYYGVSVGGRWLIHPSGDQTFHTYPPAGARSPVRIWVLGDSGRRHVDGSEAVRDAYLSYAGERETDVWLMLGDNAYNSGRLEEYQDALFDVYPTVLRNTFLWPAIGNHDRRAFSGPQNGPYLDLFDLPTRGESGGVPSTVEHFYSFDHGNVHFVVLDSEVASLEAGSPQIEWLKRDLENNHAEWTIASVHVPPYSKGSHDSDRVRRHFIVRGNALPILEAHGVDLLLSGHSHAYERSHLIQRHYGTSDTWDATAHLVDGGNGCPADTFAALCHGDADGAYSGPGTVYAVVGCSSYFSLGGSLDHPVMARVERSLGSLVIDVEGDRLDARFLQADGEIGDRFVIRHPN